jgi:limonene-1,2-epoxide hydrolase
MPSGVRTEPCTSRRHRAAIASSPTTDRNPHAFREAVEAHDLDALVGTLAPDVVLHSPVTFRSYTGREAVGTLLRLIAETFEDMRYTDELHGPDGVEVLVFRARVGDRKIEGVDMLRTGADGLIADRAPTRRGGTRRPRSRPPSTDLGRRVDAVAPGQAGEREGRGPCWRASAVPARLQRAVGVPNRRFPTVPAVAGPTRRAPLERSRRRSHLGHRARAAAGRV